VIADLTDGTSVAVDALTVDHGRLTADKDRAKVQKLCQQLERYRPNAARLH
jgi:deoxyribose-phosphate aldolase